MISVEESADATPGTARAKTSAIRSGRNVTAFCCRLPPRKP
jgi:hypothetical protein